MLKFFSIFFLLFVDLYAGGFELSSSVNLLFFGAFSMIIIYNLAYMVILNSATYASYFSFHMTLFIVMLFYTGMLEESWFELNIYGVPVGIFFLSIAMFLAFSRDFLDMKVLYPKIENSINKLIIVNLGLVVLSAYSVSNELLELLAISLIIIEAFGLLLFSAYLSLSKKSVYARFYFLSFSFLFLALIVVSLNISDFLNIGENISYLFELAILIEASGLSFALAYKHKEGEVNLRQNELLFKELSHRVQNNLQQIISILNLQMNSTNDANVQTHLEDTINRISSISLIHKTLQSSLNVGKIEMHTYLQTLLNGYQKMNPDINFTLKCTKTLELTIDKLTPLALILNELITNSIKHAFKDIDNPEIQIILDGSDKISFIYQDNGRGFGKESIKPSIGTNIINILSKTQLKGKVDIDSNNHYIFSLDFSK